MRPLSPVALATPPALSIYINELVYRFRRAGEDIITLSLGEAFFEIPEFSFSALDLARGYHYSESQGLPELRLKLAEYYGARYAARVGSDEILVTAGSKAAIYLTVLATAAPGSTVLIQEPAWLSYVEHVKLAHARPVMVPHDMPIGRMLDDADESVCLAIICNPNNPAGTVYDQSEVGQLVETARQRGVRLLFDEAYSDFLIDGSFQTALNHDPSREVVIVANSLSKNLGMSGWRLGYVIAGEGLRRAVLNLNQHIITCAPTVLQLYVARYFDELLEATLPQAAEVAAKRARVARMLDDHGLTAMPGSATFYLFVSLGQSPNTDLAVAMWLLLRFGVATVPGSAYGSSTGRYLRVSVGTEDLDRIEEAMKLLRTVLTTDRDLTTEVEREAARRGVALPTGWTGAR